MLTLSAMRFAALALTILGLVLCVAAPAPPDCLGEDTETSEDDYVTSLRRPSYRDGQLFSTSWWQFRRRTARHIRQNLNDIPPSFTEYHNVPSPR